MDCQRGAHGACGETVRARFTRNRHVCIVSLRGQTPQYPLLVAIPGAKGVAPAEILRISVYAETRFYAWIHEIRSLKAKKNI